MNNASIRLRIIANPLQLTMSARDCFEIGLIATNLGASLVDPELHRVALLVDGMASKSWQLAIGNGHREPMWFALPPGESVSLSWPRMGLSLFPRAGVFTLVLRLDQTESTSVSVRVTED